MPGFAKVWTFLGFTVFVLLLVPAAASAQSAFSGIVHGLTGGGFERRVEGQPLGDVTGDRARHLGAMTAADPRRRTCRARRHPRALAPVCRAALVLFTALTSAVLAQRGFGRRQGRHPPTEGVSAHQQ